MEGEVCLLYQVKENAVHKQVLMKHEAQPWTATFLEGTGLV